MTDLNEHISDHELRELLKQRIISGNENDPLTQQLTDMEAIFIFNTSPVIFTPDKNEKEFLSKKEANNHFPRLLWLFAGAFIIIVTVISIYYFVRNSKPEQVTPIFMGADQRQQEAQSKKVPVRKNEQGLNIEPIPVAQRYFPVEAEDTITDITNSSIVSPYASNYGIYKSNFNRISTGNEQMNVPVLSTSEIVENNKQKENIIKQILKKDKKVWSLIPMGTDVYRKDTFSLYSFYIATTEVSNQQYKIFINDLLIRGRDKDYLKALPDTAKWMEIGHQPYAKHYFRHSAFRDFPVVAITRQAAEMYCFWLTESVNEKIEKENSEEERKALYMNDIRLPQDIEWVYAARGGNPGAVYPWPANELRNKKGDIMAKCKQEKKDSIGVAGRLNGKADITAPEKLYWTAPVKSYWPNGFGLYNMSGNVAEMVYVIKNKGIGIKGGSWVSPCEFLKIDAPDENPGFAEASIFIGFRPVFSFPYNIK